MKPTVSVIVPTYNRGRLLERTLQSVATQSTEDWEVVVVDDGSTDRTAGVIETLRESWGPSGEKLRYVVLATNQGANAARNEGIRRARGRYLAFLDSDDLWHRDKLREQCSLAEKSQTADGRPVLCYTGRYRIDARGQILARQFPGRPARVRRQLVRVNSLGPLSSILVSADAAQEIGGFDESLPACQDWDFFLRLAPHCTFRGLQMPLLMYLDAGPDRISESSIRRFRGHVAIYRRHLVGAVDRSRQYPFWLDVAEDLEDLGHIAWARRFLSYQQLLRGELGAAAKTFVRRGPLGLRSARYDKYAHRLGLLMTQKDSAWLAGFPERSLALRVRGTES